jgi:hypothetical protein
VWDFCYFTAAIKKGEQGVVVVVGIDKDTWRVDGVVYY